MAGLLTAIVFSAVWTLVESLFYPFFKIPVVGPWIQNVVTDAGNNLLNSLQPAGPGVSDWFITIAETPGRAIQYTNWTVSAHRAHISYVVYNLLPTYYNAAIDYARNSVDGVYAWINNYVFSDINSLWSYASGIANALNIWVNYLQTIMNQYYESSLQYAYSLYQQNLNYIIYLYNQSIAYTYNTAETLLKYINDTRNAIEGDIHNVKLTLEFELAAATTLITTVVIPGAIAAFKAEQTVEIAAGMDELWPLVAKSTDVSAGLLAVRHPTVAARAIALPPEPVPGIGGAVEALSASASYQSAVTESIITPMMNNLEQFGEDLTSLKGIIPTVIIGGLTVAAIADPKDTADFVATWFFESFSDIMTGIAETIGIGAK